MSRVRPAPSVCATTKRSVNATEKGSDTHGTPAPPPPPPPPPASARRLRQWPDLRLPAGAVVQVRLVEVKGPRDKLSEKQHHWLRILLAAGVAAAVVKVSEPKKPAARAVRAARTSAPRKRRRRGSSSDSSGSSSSGGSGADGIEGGGDGDRVVVI